MVLDIRPVVFLVEAVETVVVTDGGAVEVASGTWELGLTTFSGGGVGLGDGPCGGGGRGICGFHDDHGDHVDLQKLVQILQNALLTHKDVYV